MPEDKPPHRPAPPPRPTSFKPPLPPEASRDPQLLDYLRRRVEALERESAAERERARSAEETLRRQEALRAEVETQIRALTEQLKREKAVQALEQEKQAARGRVEALEKRLDEMHAAWVALLKDSTAQREASLKELGERLASLESSLAARALPDAALEQLRAVLPDLLKRQSEEERLLKGVARDMGQRLEEHVHERLASMERRLAAELEKQKAELALFAKEKHALGEVLEEERHHLRQQASRERLALEEKLLAQLHDLRAALAAQAEKQDAQGRCASELKSAVEAVKAFLERPAGSKDAMLQALELEKRELLEALKARSEDLQAYTRERQEVERGLGESVLDSQRALQKEREAHRAAQIEAAAAKLNAESLKAELELARQARAEKERLLDALRGERDAIALQLAREADRNRLALQDREKEDAARQGLAREAQASLEKERGLRLESERTLAALRAQLQTLTDHLSQVVHAKESAEARLAGWAAEREELAKALKAKEEMVQMLSATFKNLLSGQK